MKLTFHGLVFACLYIGALALPTNVEDPKAAPSMDNVVMMVMDKTENEAVTQVANTEAPNETSEKPEVEAKTEMPKEEDEMDVKIKSKMLESAESNVERVENESKTSKLLEKEEEEETTSTNKAKESSKGKGWAEGLEKQTDAWHEFDDKFSLLEERYPDLTKEEFMEINHEDSIPLNFLKGFDISKQQVSVNKDGDNDNEIEEQSMEDEPLPATPIYITIPIVVNYQSTLPLTLSVGGTELPLNLTNKAPGSQVKKLLSYASVPQRQTNRHRSNVRSKIYARNKRHQVFEFKRDIE